jgi:hypothetical protein
MDSFVIKRLGRGKVCVFKRAPVCIIVFWDNFRYCSLYLSTAATHVNM